MGSKRFNAVPIRTIAMLGLVIGVGAILLVSGMSRPDLQAHGEHTYRTPLSSEQQAPDGSEVHADSEHDAEDGGTSLSGGNLRDNSTSGQSDAPVVERESNAGMVSVYLVSLLFLMAIAPPAVILVRHIF